MATLTIRDLDDTIKERLRVRAAMHGHSMEEEARLILRSAVGGVTGSKLWNRSRELFSGKDGVDLDVPSCSQDRPAPNFDDS